MGRLTLVMVATWSLAAAVSGRKLLQDADGLEHNQRTCPATLSSS